MVEIIFSRNCVYQFAYHVVWCPKYRRRILIGAVATALDDIIRETCSQNEWLVIAQEIQPDHVHLFLTIPPAISVSSAMKQLKGVTARKLFCAFQSLNNNCGMAISGRSLIMPERQVM